MHLVDAGLHEFDNRDVVPRLALGPEPMTEYESEGPHRFIGLLKESLFIKGENFVTEASFLVH